MCVAELPTWPTPAASGTNHVTPLLAPTSWKPQTKKPPLPTHRKCCLQLEEQIIVCDGELLAQVLLEPKKNDMQLNTNSLKQGTWKSAREHRTGHTIRGRVQAVGIMRLASQMKLVFAREQSFSAHGSAGNFHTKYVQHHRLRTSRATFAPKK